MPHIVLTDEQIRILSESTEPVELRDSAGNPLARAARFSELDIDAISRSRQSQAAGGRRIPSAQVQAHLSRLAAIAETEEIDEARMLELLQQMRAEDGQ